ncbi:NADH-quinone oxidoreductase subunit J [Geobacter pelophilus]|jgi:NADH-quinone oxidoreductase subunit J|uniref:NADH-quinone oxidoreductase subunit J n=1 Tax=Geoanaerobacter pelophilus TaxID=60036 RepID=A0AAW4L9V8_9BACT|nr:NADH-quinone oxidoreductase subunit J [Geoanaerobacter pelophilus]MBT0664824.1 NADH-quinone oxidoreductase subunit J [Geoanaerobacter pelophilus]
METIFFTLVAVVTVLSGIMVVTCRNPINSALSLILTFFCIATLYVTLDAPFMAAIQVLVYAGAIMVLIVFVIMLLNIRSEAGKRYTHAGIIGTVAGVLLLITTFSFLNNSTLTGVRGLVTTDVVNKVGHTELIARSMFTDFLLPFEITSILLLVAIIGAVILSKKKI